MQTNDCNSCGAPIFWALTPALKRCPIDAKPVPDGEYIIAAASPLSQTPTLLRFKDYPKTTQERYTSHFRTCPNAQQHSRKSKP